MIVTMTVSEDRLDRYTFQPGELKPVADRNQLNAAYERTGVRPADDEEQAWIAEQWRLRYDNDPDLSTFALSDEYRRLKAQGKL